MPGSRTAEPYATSTFSSFGNLHILLKICWRTGDFAVSVERRDTPRKLARESTAALRALTLQPRAGWVELSAR